MADPKRPDAKKFLEDPAFQGERELLSAFMEAELTRRATEAKAKKKPENIFDALFGVGGDGEESPSIFDVPFLPKR